MVFMLQRFLEMSKELADAVSYVDNKTALWQKPHLSVSFNVEMKILEWNMKILEWKMKILEWKMKILQ